MTRELKCVLNTVMYVEIYFRVFTSQERLAGSLS